MKSAVLFLAAAATTLAAGPVHAEGLAAWQVSPAKLTLADGWTGALGGDADFAFYSAHQRGGIGRTGATGYVRITPRIEKLFANGWQAGFRTTLNLYHDALSGDPYGNDVFEKAYGFLRTPYGRVELGQQDGAAYRMAVTGPLVTDAVALDDARISFFRNPGTDAALADTFRVRSAVFATANAAKISYYSPRLFGVQIGASYTPHMAKDVLPFVASGPQLANRQDNLLEGAMNYTGYFGQTALGAYAGVAAGHNAQQTAGYDDLFDWGLGAEIDYDFGDAVLAAGGAYRESNGYAFDVGEAFRSGRTHAVHASTKLTTGAWLFSVEYSKGVAEAAAVASRLDMTGYEASVGYRVNSNLQLTGGWQHQRLTRSSGAFYNGLSGLVLNAGFLALNFQV